MSTIPEQSKLTYDDYLLVPEDGKRYEIIGGALYANAAPNTYHQAILGRLYIAFNKQIAEAKHGLVFLAPFDVQLDQHTVIQPDLTIIRNDRRSDLTEAKFDGVPSMVIEIISPSNPSHDRDLKRKLYEQTEIAEYWMVDPEQKTVEQLVLSDGVYEVKEASASTATSTATSTVALSIIPETLIDIAGLFEFDF